MALTRNQAIVAASCIQSQMDVVETFVKDHGGPENRLNQPHVTWLEIARDAHQEIQKQVDAFQGDATTD